MINRIIDFSVNNRAIVLLLVAAAGLAGWWSLHNVPLDAIPDLGDTQVIVYSRWDRSPDVVEDQVTYPIVTACDLDYSGPFIPASGNERMDRYHTRAAEV